MKIVFLVIVEESLPPTTVSCVPFNFVASLVAIRPLGIA